MATLSESQIPLTHQSLPNKQAPTKHRGRRTGYIVTLIINAVMLYVFNNLISWEAQLIINDKWQSVLPILNISLGLNVLINLIFIFYDRRLFYLLARTITDIFSIVATIRLYAVFPFDFNGFFQMGWLNTWFPYLLLFGMVGLIIGIIARTARFISGKNIHY